MNRSKILFIFVFVVTGLVALNESDEKVWNSKNYPDIREKPWERCGRHVPAFGYICDPTSETIISRHDALALNEMLFDLAKRTKCKCQRRSQCMTEIGANNEQINVGFVVAVAFANKLALVQMGDLHEVAEKFSKTLRSRWGLGDCGNSALILIWEEQQMVHISTDEGLTKLYLTDEEAVKIAAKVKDKIENKEYLSALKQILKDMKDEFDGDPEKPVDVGTLALGVSAAVAIIVVGVITGCVCAFRCCGNLRNGPLKETLERVDSMKSEVMRRNAPIHNDPSAAASCFYDGGHSIV